MEIDFRPGRAAAICFIGLIALVSIFTALLPAIDPRINPVRFWVVGALLSLCMSVIAIGLALAGLRLFLRLLSLLIIPQAGLLGLYIWVALARQGEMAFQALGWVIYGLGAVTVAYGLTVLAIAGFGWVRYFLRQA